MLDVIDLFFLQTFMGLTGTNNLYKNFITSEIILTYVYVKAI